MNKREFIKELSKQTGYDEEKCILINNTVENHFIFGKKNKKIIIEDLQTKLALNEDDAENTYDIYMKIITKEMKKKIISPFKSQD